jgi:hypothetical protein
MLKIIRRSPNKFGGTRVSVVKALHYEPWIERSKVNRLISALDNPEVKYELG